MRLIYVANAETEWVAFLVLLILLLYSLADHRYISSRTYMFRVAVVVAMLAVLTNIVTLMCWPQAAELSRDFVYTANAAYFLVTSLAILLICTYVLMEIYATLPGRRDFVVSLGMLLAGFAVFVPIVFSNHLTDFLFVLDANNTYSRGLLNWLNFAFVAWDLAVISINYIVHYRDTDPAFRSVMAALPLLAMAMATFQQLSPQTQMSGTIMALSLLILFINCQRRKVNTDQMTGCGTRETLFGQMSRFISDRRPFTIQLVSLKNFKRINQRFGLRAGDALLAEVCETIRRLCPGDDCFRFSGADIAILHWNGSEEENRQQLRHLQERFRESWPIGEERTTLAVSFAEIAYPGGGKTREELMGGLEYCLSLARGRADGSLVRFDDQARSQMTARERMLENIQSGMTQDRFFLYYQPIVSARDERICAAEALLRLRDAEGKIIPPDAFIPLAEQNGSIIPLTWLVVKKVCEFLDRHREEGPPPVSINFSSQQFMEQDMCAVIDRYLTHYHIPPELIRIEITERMFSENDVLLMENVRKLTGMGVALYLDDFGTGYSNLASVAQLPFEVIKVDRSLLAPHADAKTDALLYAVLGGLKHMGATVLMEGVETREQVERVRKMGADRLQGYYYAKPLDEERFAARLKNRSLAAASDAAEHKEELNHVG